jgi:putative ABC transport system ATP-binding protein
MKEPAVQCKNIKKSYGADATLIRALNDVNLEIFGGDLTLLAGPSGSGKTTLLSIITGILTPDEGEVFLLGNNMDLMSEVNKARFYALNLGIVFQSLFLIPTLTVVENVSLPLLITGYSQKEAIGKAKEVLKELNIEHRATALPLDLSKGQQQRVAIARAIVNDAKILVCDEPTSALDHETGVLIMTLLQELAKKFLKAVLVVTHDHRIFSFADRIINIADGQIE